MLAKLSTFLLVLAAVSKAQDTYTTQISGNGTAAACYDFGSTPCTLGNVDISKCCPAAYPYCNATGDGCQVAPPAEGSSSNIAPSVSVTTTSTAFNSTVTTVFNSTSTDTRVSSTTEAASTITETDLDSTTTSRTTRTSITETEITSTSTSTTTSSALAAAGPGANAGVVGILAGVVAAAMF